MTNKRRLSGPISTFMEEDHARMDALLDGSVNRDGSIDLDSFGRFRQGLLRHIGLEELVLLPAIAALPGAPLDLAAKLRLDHGALTNLLVPAPTGDIVSALRNILAPHNRLEEEAGGFYDDCDALLSSKAAALVLQMRSAPEIPLRPYSKRPQSLDAAKRAMKRAGFDWERCAPSRA